MTKRLTSVVLTLLVVFAAASSLSSDSEKILKLNLSKTVTMDLLLIPAGSFIMGTDDMSKDERPAHEVTISKAFYLGKFEVTQAQYQAVMGNNPSGFKGAQNPVENISWPMAVEFCRKMSEKTGRKCRLPTEAEWEYACRAGTTNRYFTGKFSSGIRDHAWTSKNSGKKAHEVGQKKPSPWGLYDIYGNVWEWCQDWYAFGYTNRGPVIDPKGPATGKWKVHRGGSWYEAEYRSRSAIRGRLNPHVKDTNFGIRVCVEL